MLILFPIEPILLISPFDHFTQVAHAVAMNRVAFVLKKNESCGVALMRQSHPQSISTGSVVSDMLIEIALHEYQ